MSLYNIAVYGDKAREDSGGTSHGHISRPLTVQELSKLCCNSEGWTNMMV
jgi:hypothetical protein